MSNEIRKPTVKLLGEDGNAFAIMARVRRALAADGQTERALEYLERSMACGSYDELVQLTFEYVEVE